MALLLALTATDEQDRGADRRMAREGEFGGRGEDPGVRRIRTRIGQVDEYCFAVTQFGGDPLPVGGVRVVGRRVSGADGLSWSVRYDAGTAVDAEPVVAATDELVGAARDATAPPM